MLAEEQYRELLHDILSFGHDIKNQRTGVVCRTLANRTLVYTVDDFPLLTSRSVPWRAAIAELIGYLRGYDSAADFRALGCKTWDANANENKAWLANPFRNGTDDMGRVYGVQLRRWTAQGGYRVDQLAKVIYNLKNGIDDRGEIITFYNPGEFHLGCLRPCMHTYQFTLLNGALHMMVVQRSCDAPLGLAFNMVQAYTMLYLMCAFTGHKQGTVHHHIANAHIYDNQKSAMSRLIYTRSVSSARPKLLVKPSVLDQMREDTEETLNFIDTELTADMFDVEDYRNEGKLDIPFTV